MHRALLLTTLLAALLASSSTAARSGAQACNLRGSWVASTAETNRYLRAINPTTTAITVQSGALSATFDRGTFTFGSLGLKLEGRKGQTRLEEEIDIEAVAPYRAAAGQLSLGRGTYKLRYVSVVITTSSGTSTSVRLSNQSVSTTPSAVPYTCTPSALRLRVPVATGGGVTLNLRRDRA